MNRQTIRELVKARLKGRTSAGHSIVCHRSQAVTNQDMPLILISTPNEDAEILNNSPRIYQRTLTLKIEAVTQAAARTEDKLDELAAAIEAAIEEDPYFGQRLRHLSLKKSSMEIASDGNAFDGALCLDYQVIYQTTPAPLRTEAGKDPIFHFRTQEA